jgi:hypothetical protein
MKITNIRYVYLFGMSTASYVIDVWYCLLSGQSLTLYGSEIHIRV